VYKYFFGGALMDKKNEFKELKEKVGHTFKNAWEAVDEKEKEIVMNFSDEYRGFLDRGKTERECAEDIERYAIENGYVDINELIAKGEKLAAGTKVYAMNRGKAICLYVIGKKNISEGMNIVGAHIDVPRIDIKPFPLFESSEMAFLKTHYYGGIKKYQWVSLPLALHGVIINKEGEKINVCIGEDDNDPVLMISDILPHLAKDQNKKTINEGIAGEELDAIIGSMPYGDKDTKDKIKLNVLKLLNEKYGVVEEDFVSAELELVPAGKARDLGLDRSMVAAYGHDDRVCSFAGMKALLETAAPERTAVGMFMDKEEVGSQGNTGSESSFFYDMTAELIALQEDNYSDLYLRRSLKNTKVLSADVGAAYDPKYFLAYEQQKLNTSFVGKGLQIVKYTGSRGKNSCNDANAEFVGEVRKIFNDNGVVWQTGELGKVDQGGGGTIAYILANANAEVLDCGVPVICMHGPFEAISKIDLYMAYKGYKAFLNS